MRRPGARDHSRTKHLSIPARPQQAAANQSGHLSHGRALIRQAVQRRPPQENKDQMNSQIQACGLARGRWAARSLADRARRRIRSRHAPWPDQTASAPVETAKATAETETAEGHGRDRDREGHAETETEKATPRLRPHRLPPRPRRPPLRPHRLPPRPHRFPLRPHRFPPRPRASRWTARSLRRAWSSTRSAPTVLRARARAARSMPRPARPTRASRRRPPIRSVPSGTASNDGWQLVLVALAALIATVLILTPSSRKNRR